MAAIDFAGFWEGLPQWLRDWGNLLSTVVVAAATVWYVALTRSLARSATESARSAADAAQQAKESASAARDGVDIARKALDLTKAGLPTKFTLRLAYPLEAGIPVALLECDGARVLVTSVAIEQVAVRHSSGQSEWVERAQFVAIPNPNLPHWIAAATPLGISLGANGPWTWQAEDMRSRIVGIQMEVRYSYLPGETPETTHVLGTVQTVGSGTS